MLQSKWLLSPIILATISLMAACSLNPKTEPSHDMGKPQHHLSNGRFQNPPGSPPNTATFADMFRFLADRIFSTEKIEVPDHHVLSLAEFERQWRNAANPSVTWLGHAAFVIRTSGKVIVTDPFLSELAGVMGIGPKRYVKSPLSGATLPKADVLLISHNHYDHLDAETIETYPYKSETQVVVPLGLKTFFTDRGYTKVVEMDWWQEQQFDGLTIIALPAVHFSSRGPFDRNQSLWASFAIESAEDKIWFSGDTARGEVFTEIGEKVGPFDYALMAIGAYEPRKIMQNVHVTPEEAEEVLKAVGAKKAIGMHWGTIMLTPENPFDAPKRFKQAAIDQNYGEDNAIVLSVGETLNF